MDDESNECVDGRKDELEQHEPDQDWLRRTGQRRSGETRVEAKGRVECAVVDKDGEHDKSEQELRLRDKEEFGGMGCRSVRYTTKRRVSHCNTSVRARDLLSAGSQATICDSPRTASTSEAELFSIKVS